MVKWLISQGCDTNIQDSDSSTALHYAVTCDYIDIVKVLLVEGKADVDVRDGDGCTALELCETDELRSCFGSKKQV